jgi:glycosyltransferase 2 family protein
MKRIISIIISVIILGVIYTKIPINQTISIIIASQKRWLILGFLLIIPVNLFIALRFRLLIPNRTNIRYLTCLRLVMIAQVLNLVLPAKMGDLTKAYILKKEQSFKGSLALSVVFFEKIVDFISILFWAITCSFFVYKKVGFIRLGTVVITSAFIVLLLVILVPAFSNIFFKGLRLLLPKNLKIKLDAFKVDWYEMQSYIRKNKLNTLKIAIVSILISFIFFFQGWIFILGLKAYLPFSYNLALMPYAVLAGLVPLTFAGIGSRDSAIILLYQSFIGAGPAAALGVLFATRFIFTAILGLPFLRSNKNKLW